MAKMPPRLMAATTDDIDDVSKTSRNFRAFARSAHREGKNEKNIEKFSKDFKNLLTNPIRCGIIPNVDDEYVALAQLDRVFGYEPKGRGFESLMARHKGDAVASPFLF